MNLPAIVQNLISSSFFIRHRGCNVGLVLDIGAQYDELERSNQFRYTPPTHVMLGFKECLLEYSDEGGLKGRAARFE